MRTLLLSAALALAACSPAAAPENAVAPETPAAPHTALSNTAMGITGDVTVQRGGLVFANGITLFTRTLEPRAPSDRIGQSGDSYADLAPGNLSASVELRRITNQDIAADARSGGGVCGAGVNPTYVALLQDTRALSLIVFSNEEAPAPTASQSQVCATFMYDAETQTP